MVLQYLSECEAHQTTAGVLFMSYLIFTPTNVLRNLRLGVFFFYFTDYENQIESLDSSFNRQSEST